MNWDNYPELGEIMRFRMRETMEVFEAFHELMADDPDNHRISTDKAMRTLTCGILTASVSMVAADDAAILLRREIDKHLARFELAQAAVATNLWTLAHA